MRACHGVRPFKSRSMTFIPTNTDGFKPFSIGIAGRKVGEDKELHVPALLDALSIPYSGSDPASVALCYDQSYLRSLARDADILVPDEVWLAPGAQSITLPSRFPALVKPALKKGRRLSYTLVKSIRELREAVDRLCEEFPKTPLLVQEFLPGKELCVGVFGNVDEKLSAFPLLEGIGGGGFQRDLSSEVPVSEAEGKVQYYSSRLEREEQKRVIHAAFILYRRLGARDWALFNFRQDRFGNVKLLSADMNPSLFPDGKLALMALSAKMSYPEMLEKLFLISIERNHERLSLTSGL